MTSGDRQNSLALRVLRKKMASKSAVTVEFAVEDETNKVEYKSGQFLTLRLADDRGMDIQRSYSLSSSPHVDENLAVTVALVDGGMGSSWIHYELDEGMIIHSRPPAGNFYPDSLSESLVMVAAGTGIVPILSTIKSMMHAGEGRVDLLYLARSAEHLHLDEELDVLEAAHPERLSVVRWLSCERGRITDEELAGFLSPHCMKKLFICGPSAFMAGLYRVAESVGYRKEQIREERFVAPEEVPAPSSGDRDTKIFVDARIRDELFHVAVVPGSRLLDALLEQEVPAPFSCRAGICSACRCAVTSGKATMVRDDGLDESEKAAGYFLACQTVVDDNIAVDVDA